MEIVGGGLLIADHHIQLVSATKAMGGHRQKGVGIRRQVDAHDVGFFVCDMIEKPGILVAETVVILPPDVRGEQVSQRGDRPPPGDVAGHCQPLCVLVEHRVGDGAACLVAVK